MIYQCMYINSYHKKLKLKLVRIYQFILLTSNHQYTLFIFSPSSYSQLLVMTKLFPALNISNTYLDNLFRACCQLTLDFQSFAFQVYMNFIEHWQNIKMMSIIKFRYYSCKSAEEQPEMPASPKQMFKKSVSQPKSVLFLTNAYIGNNLTKLLGQYRTQLMHISFKKFFMH